MLLVGLLLIVVPAAPSAQEKNATEERQYGRDFPEAASDRIIKPAMQEKRLPGLVLGVVRNREVVVKKGYGVKSLESRAAPDENTVFHIGSLSKSLTAVGAMLLVEQGSLNLDAPAITYVKGLPESWRSITVRQFMAHQSGIPQLNRKLPTFQQMLRSADGFPLGFAPGTDQEYSK